MTVEPQAIEKYNPGHFKPGNKLNPGGKVEGVFSHDALKVIATHYIQAIPFDKLLELLDDTTARGKLSTAHNLVLTRIGEALRKDSEGRLNFAEVMDRLIGKPKQSLETHITVTLEQLVLGSYGDDAKVIEHESNEDLV